MKRLNRNTANVTKYTPKVLSFGGGNFMRAFVNYMIDIYNRKLNKDLGITVVKATPGGDYKPWREQDGLYHVLTKGIMNGELINESHLVTSISEIIHVYNEWEKFLKTATDPNYRYIVSNTTESGLTISEEDERADMPPKSFPAKLTLWLFERFQYFDGKHDFGCVLIPCELLENNGDLLKELIVATARKWEFSEDFIQWIQKANTFCNTLVDRIVPGIGDDAMKEAWEEVGFEDHMITEGEPYHIWVIQADQKLAAEIPFDAAGLNVIFTNDITPFRNRKVRILNGAHSSMVPVAYLAGIRTVREAIAHPLLGKFTEQLLKEEVLPILRMPSDPLETYANAILDRFRNPNIQHYLISIALNSFSKFKSRLLPTLLDNVEQDKGLPTRICFALACILRMYKGEFGGEMIPLKDDQIVLDKLKSLWDAGDIKKLVHEVLSWKEFWDQDLTAVEGLGILVMEYLESINEKGMEEMLKTIVGEN